MRGKSRGATPLSEPVPPPGFGMLADHDTRQCESVIVSRDDKPAAIRRSPAA